MTHNRILFLLPLMAMPLVACNNNNLTPIDYAATNELAENYLKIIKESRLKPVSSRYKLHANKLDFKGDLAYGKSFSLNDFTFSETNKTLLDAEIPTGLYSMIEEKLSRAIGSGSSGFTHLIKYLLHPEFNPHLLTIIDGFKVNEPNGEGGLIPWENVEHIPWNTMKRTYSKSSEGGLKVDVSTPSVKQTYDELAARFSGSSVEPLTFDAPLYASMSVDKYGYISSASLKFNCKGFKIGNKGEGQKVYINGDINIDATISLSHTFSKIVPIRYQTIEYELVDGDYKIKEGGVSGFYDNIDDVKYKRADESEHKVFTAQWYATNKEEGGGQPGYNYGCEDDPLFSYSFFDEIAMNEAFLHNNYDVVLVPDGDVDGGTFTQKVKFLGYNYNDGEPAFDSLCNITIDGNDEMFSSQGIGENTVAGDQPVDGVTIIDPADPKKEKTIDVTGAYNFYIDKSLIRDNGSYYLITVAFTQE